MRLNLALSNCLALGLFSLDSSDAFTLFSQRKTTSTRITTSLLSSPESAPQQPQQQWPPPPPQGQGQPNYFEQGRQAAQQMEGNGSTTSFAEISNNVLNNPPANNPPGYPQQPPADPNNPNAQQPYYPPPPPQYNPYNPYGYPQPPTDPNNPNPQQPYYPPPPPPPPAFDPNDPNAQQQAYQNPYGYQPYGYPYPPPPPPPGYGDPNAQQMPPQGQVPPPPPQQQLQQPQVQPQQKQLQQPDLTTLPKQRVRPDAKVGRNRDADNIANTADLYFAQLKLDSTIRKKAFLSGDSESSNDIFGDGRVTQLKETLLQNPAMQKEMERKRLEEQKLVEAAAEELFDDEPFLDSLDRQKPNARAQGRLSYKEKLEQSRLRKKGVNPSAVTAPQPHVSNVEENNTPSVVEKAFQEEVVEEPELPTMPDPLPPPIVNPSPVSSSSAAAATTTGGDPNRAAIRTLQGLLLKHRGGPGFGTGRLKEAEAEKFYSSLGSVLDSLKEEIGMPISEAAPPVFEPNIIEEKQKTPPPESSTVVDTVLVPGLSGSIACIEGAISAFKSANDIDGQKDLMEPLRAALMAAVGTLDKAIGEKEEDQSSVVSQSPPEPVGGMGFPSTYNIATPDDEEEEVEATSGGGMEFPSTYNIATPDDDDVAVEEEEEVEATIATPDDDDDVAVEEEVEATIATPDDDDDVAVEEEVEATIATPDDDDDVAVEEEVEATIATPDDDDDVAVEEAETVSSMSTIEETLRKIYDDLKSSAGDGKLGLKSDLSASEAETLADSLVEMKGILLSEL